MKKLINILGAALLITSLTSCDSLLDMSPEDTMSPETYFSSTRELKLWTDGFYSQLEGADDVIGINADDNIDTELGATLLGQRSAADENGWNWTQLRSINYYLQHSDRCKDEVGRKENDGVAYFMRAYFYYVKVRRYGDVPWYDKVIEMDDTEALMRPRDSRTTVIDHVLSDLDEALKHLEPRSAVGNNRINKESALAFKTRVALYEGSWQKYHAGTDFATSGADPQKYFKACVEAAEELIQGDYKKGIYSTGNPDEDYFKLFGFDDMSNINEVLLYKAFNGADGMGTNAQVLVTYNPEGRGITWELVSSYLSREGKPYDYLATAASKKGNDFLTQIAEDCDPRLKSTIWIPGDLMASSLNAIFNEPNIDAGALQLCTTGFQIKKTANPYSAAAGRTWEVPSETGLILFRYGEVLLNYAEAKYELDGTIAYDALNQLRKRAGMPDFAVNPQSVDKNKAEYGYPISDALYEIRRERRVELALEGQRDEDYKRWGAGALFKNKRPKGYPVDLTKYPHFSDRVDENGLIDYFKTVMPNGYQWRENQDYLNSIPQDELTLNPNLTQNPGWN